MKELSELFLTLFTVTYTVKICLHLIHRMLLIWNRDNRPFTIPVGDKDCIVYALYFLGWVLIWS